MAPATPVRPPLRVRFGVSEDKLIDLLPNDDANPGYVNSDHFTGYVCLRLVKPETSHVSERGDLVPIPETEYFRGKSRMFSLQFSGRFKPTNPNHPRGYWTADDVHYVVQFDGPVKTSRSVDMVAKVVMMLAPTLDAENIRRPVRPYLAANVFTSCNALSARSVDAPPGSPARSGRRLSSTGSEPLHPGPWEFGGAKELEESPDLLVPGLAANPEEPKPRLVVKRRKYFTSAENRRAVELRPDVVVGADLFNPNFNPASGRLEMGGPLKLDVGSTINYQPIKWVLRAKGDPGAVFFVVEVDYRADTR